VIASRAPRLLLASLLLATAALLGCISPQVESAAVPTAAPAASLTPDTPAPTAVGPAVGAATSAPATRLPASAAPPTVVAAQATAAVNPQALERVKSVAAEVRQLEPRSLVVTEFLNQHQLKDLVVQLFDRDYPAEEREADQRLLVTLGLVREDQSVVTEWLSLYEEQIAGMYDDDTKKLYVIGDAPTFGPNDRVTFAHEFVHALQDQYFNLSAMTPKHSDNHDRTLAIHALIEGDATLAMALYAGRELTREELAQLGASGNSSRLDSTPLILRTELIFPYTDGLRLVRRVHARGGFRAVDQAYADPPISTEQVLHPEKYDRREAPTSVSLPDLSSAAGEGWQHLMTNTLGELYLRAVIEQHLGSDKASIAAAGWGGDRWQLLTRGGETALVLRSVWDSDPDAREFLAHYGDSLAVRFRDRAQIERSERSVQVTAPDQQASVELRDRTVDVVFAPDAGTSKRLLEWLSGTP
jgi:hypothetical protein